MAPKQSRSRVGVFGSRDSSNRDLLRLFAARNERGAVLSGAAAGSAGRAVAPLPDIPRSQLYDPYAPVTVSAEVDLDTQDIDKLAVNVTVSGQSQDAAGVAVVAPQSKQGSISVSVKDASGAAVADAEVTLMVVDTAILDLMPYELQVRVVESALRLMGVPCLTSLPSQGGGLRTSMSDTSINSKRRLCAHARPCSRVCTSPYLAAYLQDVSKAMQPKLRAAFSLLHLNSLRVTRSAINATFSTLQRRLSSVDPWLPADTTVR
jgi:hypothetical protein